MDLHRSSGRPDWEGVSARKRNSWQRLAARTNGAVTPGNAFTVLGLLLVLTGIYLANQHHFFIGLLVIVVGRLCDLWDGMVAQATGTKSPLGEALDAGFDKLASLAAFIFLIVAHVVPVVASLLIFLPNLSNGALTILCGRRGITLHPSRYGKNFMAAGWVSIGSFVLAASVHHTPHTVFSAVGYALAAVSFVLGTIATKTYYQVYNGKPQ